MEELWYKNGLRFRCTRCGDCCTGKPGFVWLNNKELKSIAIYKGESEDHFISLYARKVGNRLSLRERINGDCVFFDQNLGCTIYPVRPTQCQTWPFWESNLETPESWAKTCEICPGSGNGEIITVEDICKRLKAIRL